MLTSGRQGGRDVEIYAVGDADGGGYVVYEVVWSLWAGEANEHAVHYYNDWAELVREWRSTLERAGGIERRRMTLKAFASRKEQA